MTYKNIKAEMARNGITVTEVAALLGKSVQSACSKLNGKNTLTIEEAKKIQSELFPEATLDYLLFTE